MKCKQCGKELTVSAKFCTNCGMKVVQDGNKCFLEDEEIVKVERTDELEISSFNDDKRIAKIITIKEKWNDKYTIFVIIGIMIIAALGGWIFRNIRSESEEFNEDEYVYNESYKEVYPDAATFVASEELTKAVEDSREEIAAQGFGFVTVDDIQQAMDADGNVMGYLVTATSADGFAGDVQISVGITKEGTLTGVGFLVLRETPALGMKAKEPEFKDQFVGKSTAEIYEVTKTTASSDKQVQAISGATITSRAVTGALNAAVYFVNNCIA